MENAMKKIEIIHNIADRILESGITTDRKLAKEIARKWYSG